MVNRFILLLIAGISLSCSEPRQGFVRPGFFEISCDLDRNILRDYRVVTVEKEGIRLTKDAFKATPYQTSPAGCIMIPSEACEDLVIRSDSYGGRFRVSELPRGFREKPLPLEKFRNNFDIWSYCGEAPEENEMFLKFEEPLRSEDGGHYFDKYGNSTVFKLSGRLCARVPRLPGRIMEGGTCYGEVSQPEALVFVAREKASREDFFSVCKTLGSADPVIHALMSWFHEKDCTRLFVKTRTASGKELRIFVGKNISDLSAFNGLSFKKINLSGNRIRSLRTLRSAENLEELNLADNLLLFADHIPGRIRHLDLSQNPLGTLELMEPSNIRLLRVQGTDLTHLRGLEKQQQLQALNAGGLWRLSSCHQITQADQLAEIHASGSPCIARQLMTGSSSRLKKLVLNSCGIKDLSWISRYPQLKTLKLNGNRIKVMDGLQHLQQLMDLRLSGNIPESLTVLAGMISLRNLELDRSGLCELSFLQHHRRLVFLSVRGNQIRDLRPLTHLEELRGLDASENPLEHCPQYQGPEALKTFCQQE